VEGLHPLSLQNGKRTSTFNQICTAGYRVSYKYIELLAIL
jgi:hypothetical protein